MASQTDFNRFADSELAPQIAEIYQQAPPASRVRMLNHLLQPLGTLAMVAVAAGTFARFLPHRSENGLIITADMLRDISLEHVEDLARYVGQKSPEVLASLVAGPTPVAFTGPASQAEKRLVNH